MHLLHRSSPSSSCKVPSYADKDNWHHIYCTLLHNIYDPLLCDRHDDLVERLSIIDARERGCQGLPCPGTRTAGPNHYPSYTPVTSP